MNDSRPPDPPLPESAWVAEIRRLAAELDHVKSAFRKAVHFVSDSDQPEPDWGCPVLGNYVTGPVATMRRKLTAERDGSAARIAKLEAALRPFAEYAVHAYSNSHPGDMRVGYYDKPGITVSDCRRAAALLAGTPPAAPEGPPS